MQRASVMLLQFWDTQCKNMYINLVVLAINIYSGHMRVLEGFHSITLTPLPLGYTECMNFNGI